MNKIPDYMFSRKFLMWTVVFITAFSIVFLLLYSPFSSTYWFTLKRGYKFLGTVSLYSISVMFLFSSKLVLMDLSKRYTINGLRLILFSLSEVLIISVFYVAITLMVNQNGMSAMDIFPKALMCIFLILVIPYVIAYLYGYARAYKLQAAADAKPQGTLVVSIHDNNGKIRLSLRIMDILYAVSEDNYVKIFYEQDGVVKNCMIRTTAKNIEDDLEGYITRCHRSYLINIAKVRFFNNDRDNLYVILDQDGINPIPVSRSYRDTIASLLSK